MKKKTKKPAKVYVVNCHASDGDCYMFFSTIKDLNGFLKDLDKKGIDYCVLVE